MSKKPVLKKQQSAAEAPVVTNKVEFEAFFGFVETNFPLIEETVKSVTYRSGALAISDRVSNVTAEAVTSSMINVIAGEGHMTPKLKSAILGFFVEPPIVHHPDTGIARVTSSATNRLEEMFCSLAIGNAKRFVIVINKITFSVTFWENNGNNNIPFDEDSEYVFKLFLMRDIGQSSEMSNWEFKLSGNIDVRNADVKLFNKLGKQFERTFKSTGIFTPSAISALSKPRVAIYDTVEDFSTFVPVSFPKDVTVKTLLAGIVSQNVLFKSYTNFEQNAIVEAFEHMTVEANEVIIREGEYGNYFYCIESGELSVSVSIDGEDDIIGVLLSGQYFGELALMYNSKRAATIRANSQCSIWRIDRKTYRQIVTYYHNFAANEHTLFVKSVEIMGRKVGDVLNDTQVGKVVTNLQPEHYEDGEVIIRQGNTGDAFYIIKSGNVAVWQQQMINDKACWVQLATLRKGDYFGEKALLSEDLRQASCIAVGHVTVLTLGRDEFISMFGSWSEISAHPKENTEITEAAITKNFLKTMVLEDLDVLRVLGQGAFGRVKLCQHKITGETFALKCQSKKAIVKLKIENNVINEMRLMRMIDHNKIGKLFCALQDTRNIYFVLELLQGGEFFTYLQKVGRLAESKAIFYAASVVSAYTSLHEKKIAYRDLKPENMVMDAKGYVKIVDLGLAKQVLTGKTWTMCGTPDYLAPEIILNEGHDYAVDYWALGVLIYEMVTGWPPFYAEEPMKTYEKIVACSLSFPVYITRPLSDLMTKLLTTQPGRRLGNLKGGIGDIMKHKWFGSFDWAGLDANTIAVPYVPAIKDATDVSNFENYADEALPDESTWVADLS